MKPPNINQKFTEFNFLAIYFPNIYCLFSIEDAFIFVSLTLIILLVTRYCPNSHDRGGNDESEDLMGDAQEITTSDEDGTDGINEIVHRIDIRGKISPIWHRTHRGKETRKQHQTYNEEPHHKHGLLKSVAIVGNDKSEG